MQKTIGVKPLAEDPAFVCKNSTIDRVGSDNKVVRLKPQANF